MAKITVIVSADVTVRATFPVEVEERVEGIYSSAEERAKDHVMSTLAIGASIPWKVEALPPKKLNKLDLDAERADASPIVLASSPPPAPAPSEDEIVF